MVFPSENAPIAQFSILSQDISDSFVPCPPSMFVSLFPLVSFPIFATFSPPPAFLICVCAGLNCPTLCSDSLENIHLLISPFGIRQFSFLILSAVVFERSFSAPPCNVCSLGTTTSQRSSRFFFSRLELNLPFKRLFPSQGSCVSGSCRFEFGPNFYRLHFKHARGLFFRLDFLCFLGVFSL